ncbi:solute carrier family 25 member 47 [Sceloporus undulatus]|uniref:solute carrier family 25 member 47 n=1 Tax=Sceloporus undulatus TaxID=8520 RepID=UPI001C4B415A|nr:solute carrier family 25 member 47 [Sceloporus undulatus]XP_042296303.1 solute carrier family 25 member 47 [Sceloporus undulatus]
MDFIAGAIGGGVSAAFGYPLDTIKVRIQTQSSYRGILHCILDTYRTESVLGFYRGVSMTVVMASVISSLSFGIYKNFLYNICRLRYGSANSKPSKVDISFAGAATGAARVLLISPAEIAKVRLQIQKEPFHSTASSHLASRPKYQGAMHCLRTIVKEEGLRGLYKGSLALLCRDCHSSATYFLSYSVLCEWLTPAGQDKPGLWAVLLSGGCAGVVAWGAATPMDVLKSRMQADSEGQRKYSGLIHCARDSIREEGLRVLFKGLGLNSLRAFPANMVVFFTYEAVLRLEEHLMK